MLIVKLCVCLTELFVMIVKLYIVSITLFFNVIDLCGCLLCYVWTCLCCLLLVELFDGVMTRRFGGF